MQFSNGTYKLTRCVKLSNVFAPILSSFCGCPKTCTCRYAFGTKDTCRKEELRL